MPPQEGGGTGSHLNVQGCSARDRPKGETTGPTLRRGNPGFPKTTTAATYREGVCKALSSRFKVFSRISAE